MSDTVLRAVTALTAGSSDADVLDGLLTSAIEATEATRGAVTMTLGGEVRETAVRGVTAADVAEITRHLDGYGFTHGIAVASRPSAIRTLDRRLHVDEVLRSTSGLGALASVELLLFNSQRADGFAPTDEDLMQALCGVASIALSNVHRRDSRRRFEQWVNVIEDTATILLRGVAPRRVLDDVLNSVALKALNTSGAEMAGVATPNDDGESMVFRVALGPHHREIAGQPFPERQSLMGEVMMSHRGFAVHDAAGDRRSYGPIAGAIGLGPVALGPLTCRGRVVGVLFVGNHRNGIPLDADRALDSVAIEDLSYLVQDAGRTAGLGLGGDVAPSSNIADAPHLVGALARLDMLNDRQLELVHLIAQGLSNPEIGRRLHLSEKTVRNKVSVILEELGLHNRVEVAVLITRHAERRYVRG